MGPRSLGAEPLRDDGALWYALRMQLTRLTSDLSFHSLDHPFPAHAIMSHHGLSVLYADQPLDRCRHVASQARAEQFGRQRAVRAAAVAAERVFADLVIPVDLLLGELLAVDAEAADRGGHPVQVGVLEE